MALRNAVASAPGSGDFFAEALSDRDPELYDAVLGEHARQRNQIELIASENIVSRAVLQAQGSLLTNKYAEGYPGRRYYAGCEHVDIAETLAVDRAQRLFDCDFANVQPHSGSQANQAAFMALARPGDVVMGMSLAAGGHLTHGSKANQSGKWFQAVQYGVRREDARIDFDEISTLAEKHRPKIIIAGGSAYPRVIDFVRFREIADAVGAALMVDMAHFAGLVAGGAHPSPLPLADVVTTTTHKTLRGARGGMILANDRDLGKKLDAAVFPGLQGGPLMHVVAAKAVALGEALAPEFRDYAHAVVANARVLSATLAGRGYDIVSGGTDTHLLLVDLRSKGIKGNRAESALERVGISCNKNSVPFDSEKPAVTSGLRFGTAFATSRGFEAVEFEEIGQMIADVLDALAAGHEDGPAGLGEKVVRLCARFPIYPTAL